MRDARLTFVCWLTIIVTAPLLVFLVTNSGGGGGTGSWGRAAGKTICAIVLFGPVAGLQVDLRA